jgi:hypothetical protein
VIPLGLETPFACFGAVFVVLALWYRLCLHFQTEWNPKSDRKVLKEFAPVCSCHSQTHQQVRVFRLPLGQTDAIDRMNVMRLGQQTTFKFEVLRELLNF